MIISDCSFGQKQGCAGGIVADAMWELPAASLLCWASINNDLDEVIPEPWTHKALVQPQPGHVNCSVDHHYLSHVQQSSDQDSFI